MIESYIASLFVPDWAKSFLSFLWKAAIAGLVGLVVYFAVAHHGGNVREAKIEKRDASNVNKANGASAKSRDPRTRGLLDPYARND